MQNFDSIILQIYNLMITTFLVIEKIKKIRFLKKKILVADVSLKIVFKIFFFILTNVNIDFFI